MKTVFALAVFAIATLFAPSPVEGFFYREHSLSSFEGHQDFVNTKFPVLSTSFPLGLFNKSCHNATACDLGQVLNLTKNFNAGSSTEIFTCVLHEAGHLTGFKEMYGTFMVQYNTTFIGNNECTYSFPVLGYSAEYNDASVDVTIYSGCVGWTGYRNATCTKPPPPADVWCSDSILCPPKCNCRK